MKTSRAHKTSIQVFVQSISNTATIANITKSNSIKINIKIKVVVVVAAALREDLSIPYALTEVY